MRARFQAVAAFCQQRRPGAANAPLLPAPQGVRVVSASFSALDNSVGAQEAVAELRDAGILLVAAAGNSAANSDVSPRYPAALSGSASFRNVIGGALLPLVAVYGCARACGCAQPCSPEGPTSHSLCTAPSMPPPPPPPHPPAAVAASTPSDTLLSISNYGKSSVTLAAPGVYLRTTNCSAPNAYWLFSGTSAATPVVAGAVALMYAADTTGAGFLQIRWVGGVGGECVHMGVCLRRDWGLLASVDCKRAVCKPS
jgi:subtilisin family serine protease